MSKACHEVYNFASTFSLFVPNFAAEYLHKSYKKDTFDLAELDLHNAIEHDGSLIREYIPPQLPVDGLILNHPQAKTSTSTRISRSLRSN